MTFPNGVYVTVRSVTTTEDDYGNATTSETTRRWGPCAVWDRFASERVDPHQAPVIVGKAVAGPRIAIDSDDIVVIGGVEYRVDGPPESSTVNPFTGWDPGIVVPVKRTAAV